MGGRKADFCPARAITCLRIACIKLLTRSLCDLSFACLVSTDLTAGPRHHRIGSARNFSTRHCSLRPAPHIFKHRQAMACPRAVQKSATYRSPRFLHWQRWCHRQAQNT
jgi:hypothetical protein